MSDRLPTLSYEVELGPGDRLTLTLPRPLADSVGPGRWLITVQPLLADSPLRDHAALLRSYVRKKKGSTTIVCPGELLEIWTGVAGKVQYTSCSGPASGFRDLEPMRSLGKQSRFDCWRRR